MRLRCEAIGGRQVTNHCLVLVLNLLRNLILIASVDVLVFKTAKLGIEGTSACSVRTIWVITSVSSFGAVTVLFAEMSRQSSTWDLHSVLCSCS